MVTELNKQPEMGFDYKPNSMLAWVNGEDVLLRGGQAIEMSTGLSVTKLPSISPTGTSYVENPIVLSNALAKANIHHRLYQDAGQPTFAVDTDKITFDRVLKSITG